MLIELVCPFRVLNNQGECKMSSDKFFMVFLIAACIAASVFLTQLFTQMHTKAIKSEQWPHCTGQLSTCIQLFSEGGRIVYTYKVDGVEYSNNIVGFDNDDKRSYSAQHREGERVKVFYDPENPADSVLVPGDDQEAYQNGLNLARLPMLLACLMIPGMVLSLIPQVKRKHVKSSRSLHRRGFAQ